MSRVFAIRLGVALFVTAIVLGAVNYFFLATGPLVTLSAVLVAVGVVAIVIGLLSQAVRR